MAANVAIGAIAAVLALFGGLSVAGAIDDAVPEDRWIPGIELPSVTTPEGTVPGVTTRTTCRGISPFRGSSLNCSQIATL